MDQFVGRKAELALLDELQHSPKAEFLVIYGRRRIGKTRLLTHWLNSGQHRAFIWVASQSSSHNLLRHFSQQFYQFSHPGQAPAEGMSYSTWEHAWQEVAAYAQKNRLTLIIDEFTYLAEAAPEVPSILQTCWDLSLKPAGAFLILSGSQVNMMMKAVHSYQAPLYGRATRRIHLQPFTYPALAQFFPAYQADELVATYAILGGVPAYLELFQAQMNFSENLRRVVLQPFSPMQSDSLLLLHEQFDQPALYAAILQAISMNKRSLTEIATYIDQPSTHVSRYLKILSDLGLIERQVPVTEMHKPNSRKGRYAIRDEYLRFYFRFIEPDLALLEFGQADLLLERIRPHLRAYVGEHAFEKLCRYWVLGQSARQKIPLQLRYLGSYWGSDAQLDVMATDSEHKRVLIGECKWGMEKVGPEVIEKLTRQAPKAINHLAEPAKWQPYLYLFTRTPLTEEAAVLAKTHKVEVVTLEQLDADLRTEE